MATVNPFASEARPDLPGPFSRFDSLQSLINPSASIAEIDNQFVAATTEFFAQQARQNPGATPDEMLRGFVQSPIFDAGQKNGVVKVPKLLKFAETLATRFAGTTTEAAGRRAEFSAMGLSPFENAIDTAANVLDSREAARGEEGPPTPQQGRDVQRLVEARRVYEDLSGMLPNISTDKGFETFGRLLDRQLQAAGLPPLSAPSTEGGFTLSPGQTRFSATGERIASIDPRDETAPEIVRILDQADEARAAGQTRRAEIFERRAETLAGKSIAQIRAEAQARTEGAAAGTPVTAATAIGQLRKDLANNLITPDEFRNERAKLLRSNEPLVEVQDPANPARTKFVPRSEAAGMAGPAREGSTRLPVNFLLPDGRNVLSSDGQTYLDPADGQPKPLPSNAVRVGSEGALTELRTEKAVREARERLAESDKGEPSPGLDVANAAREGTGPWANLMAAFDAVIGGVGIDKLIGQEGFFQSEQEARTQLRNFGQLAKTALINNPRFPVAEQQIVQRLLPDPDRFFTNPVTEAKKVEILRHTLQEAKRANDASLATGALAPKEISEIIASNARIDRTLMLMGAPAAGPVTIEGDADFDRLPSGALFIGPDGVQRRKP